MNMIYIFISLKNISGVKQLWQVNFQRPQNFVRKFQVVFCHQCHHSQKEVSKKKVFILFEKSFMYVYTYLSIRSMKYFSKFLWSNDFSIVLFAFFLCRKSIRCFQMERLNAILYPRGDYVHFLARLRSLNFY